MTTLDAHVLPVAHDQDAARQTYLNVAHTVRSWALTTDHKRIGVLYLRDDHLLASRSAGLFALVLRTEHLTPEGTIMDAYTYNRMFTLHGIMMVWLFMIPSIPTAFGNFLLPIMIGAKDVAFPAPQPRSASTSTSSARVWVIAALLAGRLRHGLDVLRALQRALAERRRPDGPRHVHPRLVDHHHGHQLHRHDAHAAREGHHLVPDAALRLGDLRRQHHPGARDARSSASRSASSASTTGSTGGSSTRRAAATRCSSSTSSGSTPTRPSTS